MPGVIPLIGGTKLHSSGLTPVSHPAMNEISAISLTKNTKEGIVRVISFQFPYFADLPGLMVLAFLGRSKVLPCGTP